MYVVTDTTNYCLIVG